MKKESKKAHKIFDKEIKNFSNEEKELLELSKQYCINELLEYRVRRKNQNFSLQNCLGIIQLLQCSSEG